MENPEKENRGQRSMSAPPENRQQTNIPYQEQDKPQPSQRFVSRVDITPQHNQQSAPQQPKQQQPQSPPQQQPQSNVRHIPIFVEGRDEPVISRNVDAPFQRQQSPPQFHTTPPHFQKSSPFNQRFGTRQWPPHFQETFYPSHPTFDHSPTRRTQQPRQQQYTERQRPEQQQYAERQRPEQHQRHQFEPQEHQSRQRPQRQHQQEEKASQQQQPQQEQTKFVPKQTQPKDPLEKVALVQKEVDSLAEQVKAYTGNSRKDKQYIYLDEMLTRELIKLDDIETEGRDNVRQARKNAIKTIQETISLLESKAPLPGQEKPPEESQGMHEDESQGNSKIPEEQPSTETMDVDQNTEQSAPMNEAIPLPPGPSSPTKQDSENNEMNTESQKEQPSASMINQPAEQAQENQSAQSQEQQQERQEQDVTMVETSNENTNGNEVTTQIDTSTPMEVQEKIESVVEEKKDENQNVSQEIKTDNVDQKAVEEQKTTSENKEKTKTDKVTNQKIRSPKTVKKAKKQAAPISEEPIPLPPPQSTESSDK